MAFSTFAALTPTSKHREIFELAASEMQINGWKYNNLFSFVFLNYFVC